MKRSLSIPGRVSGFSMIEVLVSLLIIVVGLLGLAGLQVRMQQAEFESYQRAQALLLVQDMVDRIHLHRVTSTCFAYTDTATGTPYLGVSGTHTPACSASDGDNNARAIAAMGEWSDLLEGAAETKGSTSVGAIVGARGCVSYETATELPDSTGAAIVGTGIYTVSVAWQGSIETTTPTVNCGNGLFDTEPRRRLVSTQFRLARLR
jgi:type IV pilus assembly protein PilV